MTIKEAAEKIKPILARQFTLYERLPVRARGEHLECEVFWGYNDPDMVHMVRDSWEEVIEALKERSK